MTTKTKVPQELAMEAAKVVTSEPSSLETSESKDAVELIETPVAPLQTAPVILSKPEKSASKAKPKLSINPECQQETVSTDATKLANIVPAKEEPMAETIVPPAAPAVSQYLKWQEIRLILEKLKDDTIREIRKSVKNGTEAVAAIEPGGDIYDQASSERDRELGLLLGDREREKIHNIDEALLRINEGDYGICEECDEDIPLGRLKAMPFTRHCVKCKSDLEKLQAQTKRVEEERAYREIPLGAEDEES